MGARVADRLLTLGAVVGALALVALALAVATGTRPVVLRSGSMAPTLGTGALALTREVPARDLRTGDVVTVRTDGGAHVTHRVVGLERTGRTAVLTLRGDANDADDPQVYPVTSAYRVYAHVPVLGRVLGLLRSPLGLVGLGGVAVVVGRLMLRGDGPDGGSHRPSGGGHRGRGRRRRTAVVGTVVAFTVLGPGQGAALAAPWTDPVTVGGTVLTADTIPPSASFTCGALGLLSVTFNWSAVPGATSYTVHHGSGGSSTTTVAGTSITFVSAISGGTAWVVANRAFGATTWSSVASHTRSYTVAVLSFCS